MGIVTVMDVSLSPVRSPIEGLHGMTWSTALEAVDG
jgi:hypothetical protein